MEARTYARQLIGALQEARRRTLELIADLNGEQLMGPRLRIVNPLRWEIGHVAWFQEYWALRHLRGQPPILSNGDALYDSARVAHDTRWDLPLPSRAETLAYMQQVLDRVADQDRSRPCADADGYDEAYFLRLALFHECMHAEAITYTRQTLGYSAPRLYRDSGRTGWLWLWRGSEAPPQFYAGGPSDEVKKKPDKGAASGDCYVPGGAFLLGGADNVPFVFDNEEQAHEVEVKPFAIARTAVSNAEFAEFVGDGGYKRRELWSEEGWAWREQTGAEHPVYWQPQGGGRWLRRNFNEWVPLEARHPVLHVNWYEADAYCRWAGRRLPTEAEWEMAACYDPAAGRKRVYPWGDNPPTPDHANLDWLVMGCVPVDALPAGDSAYGCRQMIGNVWEWTASVFAPYPGFVPGPYKEYSAPWFGDHKVLRGGCWATRSSLIRGAYRNFYTPDRRDVWAGFRTCAMSA
ncbi:MAG TPA: selenoneine synthase SenA [Blastocatellia bacterium]|nr:selenoneine synthase SenA [Blastocatellia bacterium]